ncbi:natural cytotoxicity triggering receptor 2-like isoform X4 [Tamandua tetradactyla]|uniref:natural cytotoxicity triggering receptor 2-like isoform X4 n=1 Tax=Tamandua tetradactyla TaxID=48850 RepID=UPI0040542C58
MAWETSHLPLILLLLVSGSWAWRPEAEKKRAVAGQAVSVSCPYAHRGGPYKFKTLCRKKLLQCPRLVTAFKPRTLIRASRYTVWDDPDSGFFNVTITKLKSGDLVQFPPRTMSPGRSGGSPGRGLGRAGQMTCVAFDLEKGRQKRHFLEEMSYEI